MECNCNNNNSNSNGGVIPWVRGNRLPLIICVYENVVTQEQVGDSTLTVNEMTRVPYTIQDNDTVTVIMKSGFRQVEMPFTTDGNKVMVTDNGELPTGAYTVEVTIERGDGARGRWQETRQVRIYENTSDAQLGEMYSIDADLFFYAKGDTGTGIADITNNPDGTLTITMTDGTSYVTEALKGDKGDKGDTGERGVSIVAFDVTGQTDVSVIYTVTFSDDTTQDISVPKGPQGDTGLTGNGISSTTLNSDYTLTIAYTDGTTYTTPSIRGPQGAQGVSVIGFTQTGETATNTMYNLVFSDGRTQSVAIPKGVKGDKGDTGNPGPQGAQGPKGDTVIIGDEQTYTLYGVTGQNSDGAMTQKAVTDALVGSAISYDNSQSGLAAENVQGALDEVGDELITFETDTAIEQYKNNFSNKTTSNQYSLIWGNRHNVGNIVSGIYWKCHGSATSLSVYQVKSGSSTLIKTFSKDSSWIDGQWIKLYFDDQVTIQNGCYVGVYGYAWGCTTTGVGLQFNCKQDGSTFRTDNNVTIGVYTFYEDNRLDIIESELHEDIKTSRIVDRDGNSLVLPLDRIVTDATGEQITLYENRYKRYGKGYVYVSNNAVAYNTTLNGYHYTDFIDVSGCTSIKVPACRQWGCVFFDSNKAYNGNYYKTSSDVLTPVTITVPSGTAYVQCNLKDTDPLYVYCYYNADTYNLNPIVNIPSERLSNIKTSKIVDRNGNALILPLDRIILNPTGSQALTFDNRYSYGGVGYVHVSGGNVVYTSSGFTEYHYTDFIDVNGCTSIVVPHCRQWGCVFFDENKEYNGNYYKTDSDVLTPVTIPVPSGTYYVQCNFKNTDELYVNCYYYVNTYNLNPIVNVSSDNISELKPLKSVKVAWYGTSVPNGYPYESNKDVYSAANRAVHELGGTIINQCVSGGMIISATNTAYTRLQTKRFTDIDPEGEFYSPINYKTAMLDLIGTDNEPDIFVFDYGANDCNYYNSQFASDNINIASEDITTFVGAYNTIIKALYTAKPDAKVLIVTHYSDDGASNEMNVTDGYKNMNRIIEKIADYWHVPCNPIYKKTGWIKGRHGISNLKSIWCKDGSHPASSNNIRSVEYLTKIHKAFLRDNCEY